MARQFWAIEDVVMELCNMVRKDLMHVAAFTYRRGELDPNGIVLATRHTGQHFRITVRPEAHGPAKASTIDDVQLPLPL